MIDFILEKSNELSTFNMSMVLVLLLAAVVILGFLKGVIRLLFFLAMVAAIASAFYWGSQYGSDFLRTHWKNTPDSSEIIIGSICGLAAFLSLRRIFKLLLTPLEQNNVVGKIAFGIPAFLLSFAIAVALVWGGLHFLLEKGTKDEICYWIAKNSSEPMEQKTILTRLKNKLNGSAIWNAFLDTNDHKSEHRYDLARLVTLVNTSRDNMIKLTEDPDAQHILRDDRVQELLFNNPAIQQAINENTPSLILENPELILLAQDLDLQGSLRNISSKIMTFQDE